MVQNGKRKCRLTSTDETRSGSNGNKTYNGTRAETDDGPFALKTVIPEHPGESTDRGGEVGDNASVGSAEICAQSRATIEAEPAEPEHDGTENDVTGVMRLVGEAFSAIATTLAKID